MPAGPLQKSQSLSTDKFTVSFGVLEILSLLSCETQLEKRRSKIEEEKIKEWEVRFDAERKKRDEEQFLMEEQLKLKEEERRRKLNVDFKDPSDKIN